MPDMFVSFRRGDAQATAVAKNIYDRLARYYRRHHDKVDDDIELSPSTSNLRDAVRGKIQRYAILLVIIGPNWLGSEDKPALAASNDLVRLEIEEALDSGVSIIPVLVRGANLPDTGQLPETIRPMVRNAAVVRFTSTDQFGIAPISWRGGSVR